MRYEDMPKGRNKDRCVRCGKRYNFADKALSKAKVPYDLLCLAEVTTSGYMTHGNVKLCDECMVELLMWLDRKTENSSEKPNNYCDDCLYTDTCDSKEFFYACTSKATISKMEQVEDEPQIDWNETLPCHKCESALSSECTACDGQQYFRTEEGETDCPWK